MTSYEEVDDFVGTLTMATSQMTSGNATHFPRDLNTTNSIVADVIDYLMTTAASAEPGELIPFNEVHTCTFSPVLFKTQRC